MSGQGESRQRRSPCPAPCRSKSTAALPGVWSEDVDGPGVPLSAAGGQLCPHPGLQAGPFALGGKQKHTRRETEGAVTKQCPRTAKQGAGTPGSLPLSTSPSALPKPRVHWAVEGALAARQGLCQPCELAGFGLASSLA